TWVLTQSEHLKNELHEHLRQFLPHKRMSTENEQLLHSLYKEFHSGGRYCKGKSAEFSSWMLEHHPRAFYMHIERGWASGLPQARVMMCLAHRPSIKRRKAHARTTKTVKAATNNFGYFHRLPHTEQERGVQSVSELRCQVEQLASDQLRLDWLREQIETRVIGLGWVEFRSQWSSGKDEAVGTVTDLTRHLSEILEAEQERVLPEAAQR
ncbi:MAG: hypothetical protein SGPRY_003662, partial [Prymnesium sp.]